MMNVTQAVSASSPKKRLRKLKTEGIFVMAFDYDLFVLGGGSGGVRAARMSAQTGARVALAEQSKMGGTCVVRGCVPKKFMVYASEFADAFEHAKGFGWTVGAPDFSWDTLRDRVQAEVTRLSGIYQNIMDKNDVEVFHTRAIIKDPHTVHLVDEGRDITAERILIAVGGTPFRDEAIDPSGIGIVSDDVFHLPEQPKRIVIAGGGYIAIEFAHIFAGLGTEVTLVYRGERLLKAFDKEISERVEANLKAHGVRYISNTVFTSLTEENGEKVIELANGDTLRTDEVFWAIGRLPLTDGLGLEDAGVKLDGNRAVIVDEDYRTSVPSIFAIGDVTNRVNLTPVAIREGAAFASTQFAGVPKRMDYHFIPKAVFSQPPVGSVGPTEAHCVAMDHDIDVYEADFRPMKNVLADSDERMLMKLIVDRNNDRVVACHMVGADAPEMIQIAAIAVKAGLTKQQFDETCALHPTVAEELVTMSNKRTPTGYK